MARLLRQVGHDVRLPADTGTVSAHDAVHLTKAAFEKRALLTQKYYDFEKLHELVLVVGGHHPGILVVRKDNNPRRDLNEGGIARAITKLQAGVTNLADQYIILNHWR